MTDSIFLGASGGTPLRLPLRLANRHGLVVGATGTGKSVTLRVLAEEFSQAGVPVFLADVKGDMAGMALAAADPAPMAERAAALGMADYRPAANPVVFWDVFGQAGHPMRATVSDMGPQLLARLLALNEVQSAVLTLAFRVADEQGLLLLDLEDLRALLVHLSQNAKLLSQQYGAISGASIAAIQRALLTLESEGGSEFFGEPALDLADLTATAADGRGLVNILVAEPLIRRPKLYAALLLWLLAELFERLPEIGDPDKPKLVLFLDEAHLLFDGTPKALVDQIEQVVRLIRSKGVGVYLITQSPLDIPEEVLGQLGNRVQHALRAFTPKDQKAVRTAAQTFRPNPDLDTAAAIQELAVGEALVSLLDPKGTPGMVQRGKIAPPRSRLGPLAAPERQAVLAASPMGRRYDQRIDRESAHERLAARAAAQAVAPAEAHAGRRAEPADPTGELVGAAAKSLARGLANSIGSSLGRSLVRGLLGSLSGSRR